MKNKNFITFLIGAGLGSALTWLFTSKKGKEVQQNIRSEAENLLKKSGLKPSNETKSEQHG